MKSHRVRKPKVRGGMGSVWGRSGVSFGSVWCRFWVGLGSVWECFVDGSGMVWGCSGGVWKMFQAASPTSWEWKIGLQYCFFEYQPGSQNWDQLSCSRFQLWAGGGGRGRPRHGKRHRKSSPRIKGFSVLRIF